MGFELPETQTFRNILLNIINYVTPYSDMWPSFIVKAAGIRLSEKWLLRYLSIMGQFTNNIIDQNEDIAPEEFIFAKTCLLSREEVSSLLQSLLESGKIKFKNVDAYAPMGIIGGPLCLNELYPDNNAHGNEKTWTYLSTNWSVNDVSKDLFCQSKKEAEKFGEYDYERFTEHRIGYRCNVNSFYCSFDFPLGLSVLRMDTQLNIRWRLPLLDSLSIKSGTYFESSNVLPVEIIANYDGWKECLINPPLDCEYIWFSGPCLDKPLKYDLPRITAGGQAREAVKHLYGQHNVAQGEMEWQEHLLNKEDGPFEIALLNTIARLDYPVLFGGQIKSVCLKCNSNTQIGPGTPNYDLIVLDYRNKRVLLISLKGSNESKDLHKKNYPSTQDCNKLAESIKDLKTLMAGWNIIGIVACQAERKEGEGSPILKRSDVRILWKEDLMKLFEANDRSQIEMILWEPPNLGAVYNLL